MQSPFGLSMSRSFSLIHFAQCDFQISFPVLNETFHLSKSKSRLFRDLLIAEFMQIKILNTSPLIVVQLLDGFFEPGGLFFFFIHRRWMQVAVAFHNFAQ